MKNNTELSESAQKIAVIGAGPAGLTAAYILSKRGHKVDVFEASHQVGGLSGSMELWGRTVDFGPHRFFTKNDEVEKLWMEMNEDSYHMIQRKTRILYLGKFFEYPLNILNVFKNLGIRKSAHCFFSYLYAVLNKKEQKDNFENWVIRNFGNELYKIFFKSYTEKLWGIPCQDLDSNFAKQRIKKLSLWEVFKHFLVRTQKHETLISQFRYPSHGSGQTYKNMEKKIIEQGNRVHKNTRIDELIVSGEKVVGLRAGESNQEYDHVISTMPLDSLVGALPEVPRPVQEAMKDLSFRNTILVYLEIDSANLFPDQWIYIQDESLRLGRITNFNNWSSPSCEEEKNTLVVLELWCDSGDSLWNMEDSSLVEKAVSELRQTPLIDNQQILRSHIYRVSKSYPLYKYSYKDNLKTVLQYLKGFEGLSIAGRYGTFSYHNQDVSMEMGIAAAECVLENRSFFPDGSGTVEEFIEGGRSHE